MSLKERAERLNEYYTRKSVEEINQPKLLLRMKVEIAPKDIAEILVHENDSFEEIAQEFCELHNLDAKIGHILVEKIKLNL